MDDKNLFLQSKQNNPPLDMSIGALDWTENESFTLSGFRSIEIPYKTTKNFYSVYKLKKSLFEEKEGNSERIVNFSYSNLVFYKNKNNEIQKLIVTYSPDLGCIEDLTYFKTAKRMHLNRLDKAFFGHIEIKDWDHNVLKVLRVDGGKVTQRYNVYKKGSTAKANSIRFRSSSVNCRTECVPKYGMICVSLPERIDGEEECFMREIGQDCVEICEETNDPDPNLPLPEGGTNPNNPSYTYEQVKNRILEIFNPCENMGQNTQSFTKFVNVIQNMLNGEVGTISACFTDKMLSIISGGMSGSKITLCMDASITQAGYIPTANKFVFRDELNIASGNIFHELFHVTQNQVYPGGIAQYHKQAGFGEIEFEIYLLLDIFRKLGGANDFVAIQDDSVKSYQKFLNELVTDVNNNKNLNDVKTYFNNPFLANSDQDIDEMGYKHFYQRFTQKHTQYNTYIFLGLHPKTTQRLLNEVNCLTP